MIDIRRKQHSFGDGFIRETVDELWEDWMRHADAILTDEELLETIHHALLQRRPRSRTHGRPGTPAEVVLRMLLLKHIRDWSFAELEREVRGNLLYREFTHIGAEKVPDAKTLARLAQALGPEVIEKLHARIVTLAQDRGVVSGRRMRVDTTVVGLGNVPGDQMKAASNLAVPVVGVGLLYGQGYFRQDFDSDGRQQALYPVNDPGQLPIRPLRQPNGEWLRLQIQLPGSKIWLRCWEVSVGRTKLYLLDTNDFANTAAHRGITSELYGGDAEMRLKQEIVLGIGGWRLLRALGLTPEVCHLNEGNAAFATLERARCYMEDHKKPFDLAMNVTRAGNVFTTHTAVSAGFDRFDPELIRKYLNHYAVGELASRGESARHGKAES